MKKRTLLGLATIAVLTALVGGSLYAQSHLSLQANIPFGFVASNVNFPAGEYTIRPMAPGRVLIQSADYRSAGIITTLSRVQGKPSADTRLVFNRYGNTYFLSQIWTKGDNSGRVLLKSKAEHEMAASLRKEKSTDVAATLK